MAKTANLFTTVIIEWQDHRGRDHEAEVEVDYTYDGDELRITGTNVLGCIDSLYDDEFDDLVFDAVERDADEAYAEWMADYGEWLSEQAADRRAA